MVHGDDTGLVLPYLSLGVGGSYLWVNLGDVIPERQDLPSFFSQEREGAQGTALLLAAGAGVAGRSGGGGAGRGRSHRRHAHQCAQPAGR